MIQVVDQQDNFLTFSEAVIVERLEHSAKSEVFDLAYAHGSKTQGGWVKPRTFTISGTIVSPDRYTNNYTMDQIRYFLSKPNLRVFPEGYGTQYLNVAEFIDFPTTWVERMDHEISKFTCSMRCDDPFFYDFNYSQTLEIVYTEGVQTFSVYTGYEGGKPDCHYGQSPIITITADQSENVPSFTLKNTSDDDLQIRYSDPGLVAGEFVIIDCQKGTVTRGSTRTDRFLEGEFLRLVNGENVFEYEGAACTISVVWRPRWI